MKENFEPTLEDLHNLTKYYYGHQMKEKKWTLRIHSGDKYSYVQL
jgi:hypothetical protein